MKEIFPQRLKIARLMLGFSQVELAHQLEISKQAISKYEKGMMLPESTMLLKMAKALHQKPDFFLRPSNISLANVEFRKRAKLKGKKLESLKAHISDVLERYLELENIMGINSVFKNPIKNISIQNMEDVEKAGLQLLKSWKLGLNPLPNIIELLEDHGIKVIEVDFEDSFDGLSTWVQQNIPIIVVNKNFDVVRKRFTVLHELGHLLLQIPEDASHKEKEGFCNRFPGAFLIPASVFKKELGEKRPHPSINELVAIKEYYGISIAALVYRAKDLEIISENMARNFWRRRNQNKNLKKEIGYGIYEGKEKSGRFHQLLYNALAEEIISISKGAYLAKTSIHTIKNNLQLL
jgi:Zn-dependent peptidase ImmA (M78 family)/transcriptional regulator with XRE-family HTH domain